MINAQDKNNNGIFLHPDQRETAKSETGIQNHAWSPRACGQMWLFLIHFTNQGRRTVKKSGSAQVKTSWGSRGGAL